MIASPNQGRIYHKLHALLRLDRDAFIQAVYRNLLHRDPTPEESSVRQRQLAAGTSKLTIALELIVSSEADRAYAQLPREPIHPNARSIGNVIQQFIHGTDLFYVYALYSEVYGRVPRTGEVDSTMATLRGGTSRLQLLASMLASPEGQAMLSPPSPPEDQSVWRGVSVRDIRSDSPVIRVGLFLMFPHEISLEGEGIGRFTKNLMEGLLARHPNMVVHVVTAMDSAGAVGIFGNTAAQFPGRMLFHATNSVETVNREVGVDVWIVPYVGLALALGLERPIVLCMHDLVFWHFPRLYYESETAICHALDRFVRDLAYRSGAVVFSSEFTRQHEGLRFLGLPPDRTHIVRPATPDVGIGVIDEAAFRDKYQLHGSYIAFPTVLRLHKNGDRLIAAYMHYRESPEGRDDPLHLVFTDTLEHARHHPSIRALLDGCPEPIRQHIRFLGRIPGADLPSLYRYAAGTIVPTLFEGSCPFPILESLSVGTPVAASRIGVVAEAANPDLLLGFDPYDIGSIAHAISRLRRTNRNEAVMQRSAVAGALHRTWNDVAVDYGNVIIHALRLGR